MRKVAVTKRSERAMTLVEVVFVLFLIGSLVGLGWPRVESAVNKSRAMECETRIQMIARAKSAYAIDHLGHMSISTDEDWDVFNMYFWEPISFHCPRVGSGNTGGDYDIVSVKNLYDKTVCRYCAEHPVR